MDKKELLQEALDATLRKLREVGLRPSLVYLDGSRLYGLETEESDFDFQVYVEESLPYALFSPLKNMELRVDEAGVDAVKVKSFLELGKKTKLAFNDLHLLSEPVYGNEPIYLMPYLQELVRHNWKSLVLSMLGMEKKYRLNPVNNSRVALRHFFLQTAESFVTLAESNGGELLVENNYFSSSLSRLVAASCMPYKLGEKVEEGEGAATKSDSLFQYLLENPELGVNLYNYPGFKRSYLLEELANKAAH